MSTDNTDVMIKCTLCSICMVHEGICSPLTVMCSVMSPFDRAHVTPILLPQQL